MHQNPLEWDCLKEKKSEALSESQENSCWTWEEKILFSHENIRVLKVLTSNSIFGWMMKVIKVQTLKQSVKFNCEKDKNK